MFPSTRRPSPSTCGRAENLESSNTAFAADLVACAALPIAIPKSASFNARASFTPSTVIATHFPLACKACTRARFCSGVTRPNTWCFLRIWAIPSSSSGSFRASKPVLSTPSRPAKAATVTGLSPEIIRTSTPSSLKKSRVWAASSRKRSVSTMRATSSNFLGSAGFCGEISRLSPRAKASTRAPCCAQVAVCAWQERS